MPNTSRRGGILLRVRSRSERIPTHAFAGDVFDGFVQKYLTSALRFSR
jgi:hypothetical protein